MRLTTSILALLCASTLPPEVNAQYCKGLDEPEIKEVIAAARELAEFVEDDEKFPAIKNMSSANQKAANAQAAMQPIDFTEEKHRIDRYALGEVVIESKVKGVTQKLQGSAYKVSRSCIVTAAHVLYPTTNQEMSKENKAAYNGKITFVRGTGPEKEEIPASVFFQMTKPQDYLLVNNERHFKARSDITILRLDKYSDNYFKPIRIFTTEDLLKNIDYRVGKKITCIGSPSHMTLRVFGGCKGSEFKWKQENARIFQKDITRFEMGIVSNLFASPGMSGGVCYLASNPNEIIGVGVNGFILDDNGNLSIPNINFQSTDTINFHVRHIAIFDLIDLRMREELGYGIMDLDEHCN